MVKRIFPVTLQMCDIFTPKIYDILTMIYECMTNIWIFTRKMVKKKKYQTLGPRFKPVYI